MNAPTVTDVTVSSTEWAPAFIERLESLGLGSDGYSIPVGGADQETPLPWRNIDQIRVTFSEDVIVDASDIALTGVDQTQYAFSDFDYFPESNLAIWTLESPLSTESYWIELNADGLDPIRDLGGAALDGEWTNSSSVYSSGDGVAGGDFEFAFRVLPGDALGIDLLDYNNLLEIYYREGFGLPLSAPWYLPFADGDGDGLIDEADWQQVWDNLYDSTPSGAPVGSVGDAPTTDPFDLLSIDDDSIDVDVWLYSAFADAEDHDIDLTFAVVSNSDPSLFDTVSIDHSIGRLTLNATAGVSGRAELVLSATDTQGLSVETTLTVDVNRQNVTPSLTASVTEYGGGQWLIEGWVADPDDDLDSMFVDLVGGDQHRTSVAEDGYFFFTVLLDPGEIIFIEATVSDLTSTSDPFIVEVGAA